MNFLIYNNNTELNANNVPSCIFCTELSASIKKKLAASFNKNVIWHFNLVTSFQLSWLRNIITDQLEYPAQSARFFQLVRYNKRTLVAIRYQCEAIKLYLNIFILN